ncbi:RHS repeat-associated core domain-containing protein [Kribbella antiqua]|uniref:RHS repeat-associated core domain-containing protein n=1 Tax=Kribbella antiqua TaxID=2512217 RepID=UPI001F540FFC|nr:RHS repeat-associated core domain-containing protein [Kribbella antiqua]
MAILVSFALLVTGLEVQQAAAAAPAADPRPAPAMVASRPDLVSAVVTARSQGSKVEVESMRSETSTTWANPDGTMTTEAHASPIRFKTAKGAWQSIDLTLAMATDGTVASRGHGLGLQFGRQNSAVGGVFASATAGTGRQVEWLAPWKLSKPTLAGTKATYTDVQPGVDLRLDARRSGFEVDFVVKQRPATAPTWRIPLRTKGLTARQAADGVIEFVDAKGVVRSRIPVGQMWDAVTDEHTKMPVNTAAVSMSLEQVSPGKATLVLAPDAAWLLDPARVFPVTVDPTYANVAVMSTFDTFVQSGWPNDLSSTVDLRVGKNGTATERSFLNFPGSSFQGKKVVSAYLSLMQYGSTTCTATQMNLHASLPASTSTRWSSMPVTSQQVWGSVSAAKGFSSACAADRVYVNMTGLAQYWSGTTDATVAVMLKAANEADANAWKRFYSTEGPADPYISLTWNRPPNQPATVETTEAVPYAAPGDTQSYMYSPTLRPWVRTKATDPDGNTVKYVFEFFTGSGPTFNLLGTCTSSVYASGTTAGCRPAADLPDNTLLYIRAKANDGSSDGPWTSYQSRLRIGAAKPAAPEVSCPAPYDSNNTWQDNPPAADVVCTVAAAGAGYIAPGYVRLTVDGKPVATNFTGGAAGQIKITPSSDPAVAKTTVTIPKGTPGLHTINAYAETPAGLLSASPGAEYSIGWGGTSLSSPSADRRITTAGGVTIAASGPPKGSGSAPTAKLKWRLSGYDHTNSELVGWNDGPNLTVTDNGTAGVIVNGVWDTTSATTDSQLDADPNTAGVQPTTVSASRPVLLDVQVCLTYTTATQCTWSQQAVSVLRVPHAFGGDFPTAAAGAGQVALWTGEFNLNVTDASVGTPDGSLALSRSHSTFDGPTDATTGIFGPGWTAQLDGPTDQEIGIQVLDSSRTNGIIAFLDGVSTPLVFSTPDGARRSTATFPTGTWQPADQWTTDTKVKLTVSGTGLATKLTLANEAGDTTTFVLAAPLSATTDAQFKPDAVTEADSGDTTRYLYDPANPSLVARILAPAPTGVTCVSGGQYTGAVGCQSLRLQYGSGATSGLLTSVWLDVYNPAKTGGAGMDSIQMATYSYDTSGRLASVTDPRSGLTTGYTYDAANRLTSVTPPGLKPYVLNYAVVGANTKLTSVTRVRPSTDSAGGVATLASFVYDVQATGPGLPDLSSASVARWGQRVTPTHGFAVFGPDHPAPGTTPGEVAANDWQYAQFQYTDDEGVTINTADFGAGAWQYSASERDEWSNITRSLDQRAIREILDNALPSSAADLLGTTSVYNDAIQNTDGVTIVPADTRLTDTYGPVRDASTSSGTVRPVRLHTHLAYDENAPNGGISPFTNTPYGLMTSTTKSAFDPGASTDEVVLRTIHDYSAAVTGGTDGWEAGEASRIITDLDLDGQRSTGDLVSFVRRDSDGRVVENRQPKSADAGGDAGTTLTAYYTAGTNSDAAECGNKPEWAGLTCKTSPAAAPSSAAGQPATPSLPSSRITQYNYLLQPTVIEQTSGSVTRTATTVYRLDGQVDNTRTTVTGMTGSAPNTAKYTTYDPATGAATTITARNSDATIAGTVTTTYDTWGRPISYQPSGETATTTAYDIGGGVKTIVDPNGTTQYTYDGTDAAGRVEHRGLPTKIEITSGSSIWSSTGAYDAAGTLTVQKLPGGIARTLSTDITGSPVGLDYTGQLTTVNPDGSSTTIPDGGWLSWSQDRDVVGRVTREWTPDGAAFTGPPNGGSGDVGDAIPYDRSITYDPAGRLTRVNDRTAAGSGVDVTDPAQAPACTTRTYAFDTNGNRLSQAVAPAAGDGSCTTAGGTTATHQFDTADRPTSGASGQGSYVYDALGRTLTIPASDAPKPAAGDISLTYFDNDIVKSITQAGSTTTLGLDAMDRRSTETVGATQTVRHYTDTSDNPTWISDGATSTRYARLIDTQLGLIVQTGGSAQVPFTNFHGDIVTTSTIPNSQATATSIGGWSSFDEYGQAQGASSAGYAWLGGATRSTTDTGLILLGARVYNPATGLFTSQDPVAGGSNTSQGYCNADPVNCSDISGLYTYTLIYALGHYRKSAYYFFMYLIRCFTCYFPIPGARALKYNTRMDLRPGGLWFPVWVQAIWWSNSSAGWRFKTLHGHPDYPGYIQFTFTKSSAGWLYLTIYGWVPWWSFAGLWIPKPIYVARARRTWNQFALNLWYLACRTGGSYLLC